MMALLRPLDDINLPDEVAIGLATNIEFNVRDLEGPEKDKAPSLYDWGPDKKLRQRPTLPHGLPCSTIGPGGLNFRVRDGIGCGPSGNAAGNLYDAIES